jgi:uncharacterized membrane protein
MANKTNQQKSGLPINLPIATDIQSQRLLSKLHSVEGRLADVITQFAGSMMFAYVHAFWFAFWIIANEGWLKPYVIPFDPFPYGLLTMIVSLEAIFLSTFIMVAQNRQALVETYREIEEEKEEQEAEEEVEDIQKDLDDIKSAISFIQQKITSVEKTKTPNKNGNGNGGSNPSSEASST